MTTSETPDDIPFISFDDYTLYVEYTVGTNLWNYVPPILLVFGTTGNILSIIVLRRKNLKKSICTIYFVALAISDLLVLYTGLLRQWIYMTFDVDIRHIGMTFCKVHTWILYFSLDFSAWIQIAVTVERLCVVWFPHSIKYRCTRRAAICSLGIMACCLLAVNSHILYGMGDDVQDMNGTRTVNQCTYVSKSYKEFFTLSWPWIYLTVFFLVPFCLLCIGNLLIILKVLLHKRLVNRRVAPVHGTSTTTAQPSKLASMSITLFTLNTVFLVCNIPISIYLIEYENLRATLHGKDYAVLEMVWAIVNILMYSNNALSFVLYILSGTRFRREFTRMLCCKKI